MTDGQIGNVDLVKQLNSAAVYRLIDIHGPISRIQIADVSHLAPASVTKITRQLLERGLIMEVDHQASTGGRRAISLTSVNKPFHAIAVRLGRDYLNISLHDLSGTMLATQGREFYYTTQQSLVEGLFSHIKHAIEQWRDKIENLAALGLTLPGLVNPDKGIVEYMPHIKVSELPLEDLLRKKFGVEVFIGNAIRGFALAEHYFGRTQDCKDSILVSVHNGTGAGIIVNNQIFLGSNRNVGEIGHIQIDPLGDKCQCGNFGCLETIAANPAIIKRVKQRLEQGYPSQLSKQKEIGIRDICQAANQGDELSKQVIIDVGNQLGKAIAMTVNLFNPEKVIIAGDIIVASEHLLPAIQRQVTSQSLPSFHRNLPIETTALADMPTISAFAMVKRAMLNGVLLQKLLGESS